MSNPQKSAMDAYLGELTGLVMERANLSIRISKLEKVLRGMIDLLDTNDEQTEYIEKLDEITPPAGLTEAIQQLLASDINRAFLPTEIRDRVRSYLLNHSNQMASVHTTLKRLSKNNPFINVIERDGKTAYQMMSPGDRMVQDMMRRAAETKKNPDTPPRRTVGHLMAERQAVEEMRESGSDVGDPLSLETPPARGLRPQERFKLGHTKVK
jgi:hypothetical protein